MANAFYRNTSSGGKKKNERERKQASFMASDEAVDSADAAEAPASRRKGGAGRAAEGQGECGCLSWMVSITPSTLVTISVLSLILLGFSFLSGVIVGRGSMPLPQAMQLEKLLAEDRGGERDELEQILPKEELRFMTSLKSEEAEGVLSDVEGSRPRAAAAGQKTEAPRKKVEKSAAQKTEKKPEKKEVRQQEFDYVLRVAAFRDAEPARKLAARLAKADMKSRQTQAKTDSGTWHYVQVLMRGTAADLQVMRRKLDSFRLHDAMVISKKAVGETAKGKTGNR